MWQLTWLFTSSPYGFSPSCLHPQGPSACAIEQLVFGGRRACPTNGAAPYQTHCSPAPPFLLALMFRCDHSPLLSPSGLLSKENMNMTELAMVKNFQLLFLPFAFLNKINQSTAISLEKKIPERRKEFMKENDSKLSLKICRTIHRMKRNSKCVWQNLFNIQQANSNKIRMIYL